MDLEIGENVENRPGNGQKVMSDFSSLFPTSALLMLCFNSPTCEISDFFSCKAFQALVTHFE